MGHEYNERDGSIELRCTLSHELKNAHILAHTWIERASKAFNELLGSRFDSDSVDIVTEDIVTEDIVTEDIVTEDIVTEPEDWDAFMGRINYVRDIQNDAVVVAEFDKVCTVWSVMKLNVYRNV